MVSEDLEKRSLIFEPERISQEILDFVIDDTNNPDRKTIEGKLERCRNELILLELGQPSEYAKLLIELSNADKAKELLTQDMERLSRMSPGLAKKTTVEDFLINLLPSVFSYNEFDNQNRYAEYGIDDIAYAATTALDYLRDIKRGIIKVQNLTNHKNSAKLQSLKTLIVAIIAEIQNHDESYQEIISYLRDFSASRKASESIIECPIQKTVKSIRLSLVRWSAALSLIDEFEHHLNQSHDQNVVAVENLQVYHG